MLKNTILKKQNKVTKIIKSIYMKFVLKYIYEVCFKSRVFFGKVIVGYKNENIGVIENLILKTF